LIDPAIGYGRRLLFDYYCSAMPEAERYQQYEVLRRGDGSLWELGRGAMGITYKAFDTNLRCAVALKVINSTYLQSDTARQRFLREARAAAALRHPNVASVFNLSTDQDNYFYVMEFIDGETVEARVKRNGRLEPVEALNVNGVLAFNRSDSVTFNGVISGQGTMVKQGGGTLTLTGMSTEFTGPTTVNDGSLIVDGSIASTQTLVNPGALLGGHGFLGGDLVSSGIVSPGNSPGTLTVNGNYTQNANGTLRIEVAGLAPSQHDLLVVNGHASLAGTLQLISLGGFQLHIGDKVTFLTAQGGVSGNFSTVQNDFATLIKTQIIILPNAVVVQGAQGSFAEIAMTPNCAAVARALDSAVGDPRASTLINFLNNEPINKLCPGDFDLISPEQLASVFNIAVALANAQSGNVERQLDDVRAGSTGFNSASFKMNGSTPSFSGGLAGPTGAEGKSGPSVLAPIPENRWGVFAAGLGEFTHVDSTDNARGYDLQTGGVTLGVDYRIGSNFAVGLIAGYAHTNTDLPNNGNMEVNSGKFGLYGTAFSGGFTWIAR
jgi:outer membrane autotransporter protein